MNKIIIFTLVILFLIGIGILIYFVIKPKKCSTENCKSPSKCLKNICTPPTYTPPTYTRTNNNTDKKARHGFYGYDVMSKEDIEALCTANTSCKGYYVNDDQTIGNYNYTFVTTNTEQSDCQSAGDIGVFLETNNYSIYRSKSDGYTDTNYDAKKAKCTKNFFNLCRGSTNCEGIVKTICDKMDNCDGYYSNGSDGFIASSASPANDINYSVTNDYESDNGDDESDYIYFMRKNV